MDTFPLYNFLSFLGLKYITGIIVLAVILAVAAEVFATNGPISSKLLVLNAIVISALLALLAFIIYVIYNVYVGEYFKFIPLAVSASVVIFITPLALGVRAALLDSYEFRVLVFLALIVSLVGGAVFSAFVKVVQRFISA